MKTTIEFSTYKFEEAVEKVKKLMEEDFVLESINTESLYGNGQYMSCLFLVKMIKDESDY